MDDHGEGSGQRLLRLVLGLAILACISGFFMSGLTPPGIVGEVLRHNQSNDIDASPLFYSEVEHMAQLEHRVKMMRRFVPGGTGSADTQVAVPGE